MPQDKSGRMSLGEEWTNMISHRFQKRIYSCVLKFDHHKGNDPKKVGCRTAYVRDYAICKQKPFNRRDYFVISDVPGLGAPCEVTVP
jgi:hypothetical protein